jgi:hypothetical protein
VTAKGGEAYFAVAIEWTDGSPLVIDGLWGLTIGNGSALGGSLDTLFFTAGPNIRDGFALIEIPVSRVRARDLGVASADLAKRLALRGTKPFEQSGDNLTSQKLLLEDQKVPTSNRNACLRSRPRRGGGSREQD